ncbi:hypothetical protein CEQ90_05735 [Lewinellaceae bacterium SD302]|nr:hypothetical protein CEQ90_05735 [Lewinellaceae bacterium SD302]
MPLDNIKIISAGAGSGKTYRLTQEMTRLLTNKEVKAAGIIATTFTKKAAAELKERVRVKLLSEGLTQEANELSNALIGTVHGLGVKLLQRFAFEAGVSPQVEIIPDSDHQQLFNLSMAAVIDVPTIERIESLINRLGLTAGFGNAYNWRKEVRDVVEVIRANDFGTTAIQRSKEQSWQTFADFLPPAGDRDLNSINQGLLTLLDSTQMQLEANEADQTKTSLSVAQKLRNLHRELQQKQYLSWQQWAGLCKLKVGAKSREIIEDLTSYANGHLAFKAFQDDVRNFIELIFDCAEKTIREYADYKQRRGQIDYTDMEVLVLRLLENQTVKETLSKELDLLMVDEFQDTSPIQLAIFLELSKLANQSIWVGDPKQSIYGFRGAEPKLMAAVIAACGGVKAENIQEHSYRSREDLVYVSNDIFTRAFSDLPEAEVRLNPKRKRKNSEFGPDESPEQAAETALWHWHYELDGKGRIPKAWKYGVLARSVAELLADPPLIRPKGASDYRPLRAEDIAILCRSNFGCRDIATALHDAGLPAAVARDGLLSTAESTLILACLKYMLNSEDSLSVAEIKLLANRQDISEIIEDRLDYVEQVEKEENRFALPPWGEDDSFITALDEMREDTQEYAPSELLNHLLDKLDLRRIIVSWGNGEQRLSNVDELRKIALEYEENSHRQQQAASVGGFLLALDRLARERMDRQGAGERPEAVNVLTYHRSKGLEWPIVICNDLDQGLRADLWGRAIISEVSDVDINRPLAGRWLRYWVNPYGVSGRGLELIEAMDNSHWQEEKTAEAKAEEARLLYVGITRARDYLVLPTTKDGAGWLDRVYGTETVLDPASDQAPFTWKNHEVDKRTRHWTEPKTLPVSEQKFNPIPFMQANETCRAIHITYEVGEREMITRFPVKSFAKSALHQYFQPESSLLPELATPEFGQVIAAFCQADHPLLTQAERTEMAETLLSNYAIPETADADELLERSDTFQLWLQNILPLADRSLALPYRYYDGPQLYASQIDILLRTNQQSVIINHCVLASKKWDAQLNQHLPSLHYQAWASKQLLPVPLVAAYIHLPLQGTILKLEQ